jgi:hypothetical protein
MMNQMQTREVSLQGAIISIKRNELKHGKNVTEEEMAQKLNISEKQLFAYINGEERVPDNFVSDLLSHYGIKQGIVQCVSIHSIRQPEDEEQNSEHAGE